MYKLQYSLLLVVVMYAGSTCGMTSRSTQLGRGFVRSAPRAALPAAASYNRPFATSTPRVVPTWSQQALTAQQAAGVKPFAAESEYKKGSGGSSFWERYQNYGLTAAFLGFFALSKDDLYQRERDAFSRLNQGECKYYVDQVWPRSEKFLEGPDREIEIRIMKAKSPKCIAPFKNFYEAKIASLRADLKDSNNPKQLEQQIKELEGLLELLKPGKSDTLKGMTANEKGEKIAPLVIKEREAREALKARNPRLVELGWHDAQDILPKMKSKSPQDASLYNDYLAARIKVLEEENRQVVDSHDPYFAQRKIVGNRILINNLKEYQELLNK